MNDQELAAAQRLARKRVIDRARAKHDRMHLANDVLGYDFQACHAELFSLFPDFDDTKPWVEQIAGYENVMVLFTRGHYKSTAAVVIIIQAILNNPDISILLMRGSLPITKLLFREIKSHFLGAAHGSKLTELFPEFKIVDDRKTGNTALTMIIPCRKRQQTPTPTLMVASPRAIKTGMHFWLGWFDDLQHEGNWRNPKMLEQVREDFKALQPLVQNGARWVTGTRWTFGDLYEWILSLAEQSRWKTWVKGCWTDETANLPDDKKVPRMPRFVKKDGQWDGWTREDLLRLEAEDPAFFACQYLCVPVHIRQQSFTEEMFWRNTVVPSDAPTIIEAASLNSLVPALGAPVIMVDLAHSSGERADDTVLLMGQRDALQRMWVTHSDGGQWTPQETANRIIAAVLRFRPTRVVFEKSAAGLFFVEALRLIASQRGIIVPVDSVKIDTKKNAKSMRIMSLAAILNRDVIKFCRGLPRFDKLIKQAVEFDPRIDRHDDWVDCLALMWGEIMKDVTVLPAPKPVRNIIFSMVDSAEQRMATEILERGKSESPEWVAADQSGFE